MTLDLEGVVDRGMSGEEALGRRLALEQQLLSLASSDRQVRVLRPIVLPQPTGPVKVAQAELIERGAVRPQAGDDHRLRSRLRGYRTGRNLCVSQANAR